MKNYLRQCVFANPILFEMYKWVRATETHLRRYILSRKYAIRTLRSGDQYSEEKAIKLARSRIEKRGIDSQTKTKERLRIFLFGANETQDKTGFLQALDRMGDLIVFKNRTGTYGPERDATPFKTIYVERNDAALLQQLVEEHSKQPIDILIGQMWAHRMSAEALRKVQSLGIITLNIAMDDRLPWHWGHVAGMRLGAIGLKDGVDLTLTTAPECCSWYWAEGAPAIYFPLGSDPNIFVPTEKTIDVSFVGSKYGIRQKIVDKLIAKGINIEAFGPGWPNGHVDSNEASNIFNRSRIILGIGTVGYNEDLFTMKLRDFDAPMSGALYITHRTPELEQIFKEDQEIAFYKDESEAAMKIRYFLEHRQKLEQIGANARAKASTQYTWDIRLQKAFAYLGIEPVLHQIIE